MTSNIQVFCIECLRLTLEDGRTIIHPGRYGEQGSNNLMGGSKRPALAEFVVDGTWYCALHAVAVYQPVPDYVIQETA